MCAPADMNQIVVANPEQIAALGRTVLAARVTSGIVPQACHGLSLKGMLTQRYGAGQQAKALLNGKLWWVHPGPYTLRFAPNPACPELGVLLELEAATSNGLLSDSLAYWLDDLALAAVTLDDLISLLAGHILLQLPPCVQRSELQDITLAFSSALIQSAGLRCNLIQRCDLFQAAALNAAKQTAPDVSPVPERQPLPYDKVSSPEGESLRAPVAQAREQDARFVHRLFLELPRQASRLRELPWAKESEAIRAQRAILDRLTHLAATTGRLPELSHPFYSISVPTDRVLQMAQESRHATDGLDQVWGLLDGLPKGELASLANLELLDIAVSKVEHAIAARKHPWWMSE